MEAAAPERADGGSDGEEESSGIAAPLESLPPTVVFFDVPPRQSSGFVLDFGEPERPPDLSPRRNSSGPLDLITLLTEEAAETPAAAPAELGWLKRRQAQRGRPAAGAGAKAGGAPKPKAPSKQQRIAAASMVLSQEQLEELSSHFRAVPLAEVRSGHVHFTRLAAGVAPAEGFGGEPTIERRQLPELFVLIGLRLTLRMGGAPTDRFRFRDVLRILQALRDEEAMMQIPISPMPDEHAGADEEEMLMHTNPLFLAMKQRDDGALGAGVLELSGANRAVLLLPCNARLEGVEITRELVEAHVAQRIADLDAAQGAEAPPPTAFRTLSGLSLDIDGDVLRIGAGAGSGAGAVAGPTLQVLEREQFFDEDCLRHEVLWLSDILSESSAEQQGAEGDGAAEGPGADGVMTALQAYTLFDHRNSYQEMMAFLFMFTPPPGSPGSGLTEAVAAAARVNQAASTMLSEILAARGGNGTGGRLRGRRRSVSSLGSLGRGNPKLSTEAALTTRLGQFVREARVWQSAAADRVARSLMEANRRVSGERDAGRQLQSLRGAVGAYIAAETHRLVVQVRHHSNPSRPVLESFRAFNRH